MNLLIFLLSQSENENEIKINPVSIQINLKNFFKRARERSRFGLLYGCMSSLIELQIDQTTEEEEENSKHASVHTASAHCVPFFFESLRDERRTNKKTLLIMGQL